MTMRWSYLEYLERAASSIGEASIIETSPCPLSCPHRRPPKHRAHQFEHRLAIDAAVLNRLKAANRLTELLALVHIVERVVEHPAREPDHLRRGDPPGVGDRLLPAGERQMLCGRLVKADFRRNATIDDGVGTDLSISCLDRK
jgi:hypothetical protein